VRSKFAGLENPIETFDLNVWIKNNAGGI